MKTKEHKAITNEYGHSYGLISNSTELRIREETRLSKNTTEIECEFQIYFGDDYIYVDITDGRTNYTSAIELKNNDKKVVIEALKNAIKRLQQI